MTIPPQLSLKISELYKRLDSVLQAGTDLAGTCFACGKCCNFDSFGHRLFITQPELDYLAENLAPEKIRRMPVGRCPYNVDNKCSVYPLRFSGCRIFCCRGNADFQSELTEKTLAKLKSIGSEVCIPYKYMELSEALNSAAGG